MTCTMTLILPCPFHKYSPCALSPYFHGLHLQPGSWGTQSSNNSSQDIYLQPADPWQKSWLLPHRKKSHVINPNLLKWLLNTILVSFNDILITIRSIYNKSLRDTYIALRHRSCQTCVVHTQKLFSFSLLTSMLLPFFFHAPNLVWYSDLTKKITKQQEDEVCLSLILFFFLARDAISWPLRKQGFVQSDFSLCWWLNIEMKMDQS